MATRSKQISVPKPDMTPMIDCVFQLMIFFMLTLKIVAAEGNFDINMPLSTGNGQSGVEDQEIKVRLIADEKGNLATLRLGARNLGVDDHGFSRLNSEILRLVGQSAHGPLASEPVVEIDADENLHYQHVIRAISACSGRIDPKSGQIVRFIEKIKFAAPRPRVQK